MEIYHQLQEIGTRFRLLGQLYACETITAGNINRTYKTTFRDDTGRLKSYVMQRVNTRVFRSPRDIMENIDRITAYMRAHWPEEPTLHFHHTAEGANFAYDQEGAFWRVMNYVDAITFDTCDDPVLISGVGEAFGRFQRQLDGFDGRLLHETIPDFHNTQKRMETLFADAETDSLGRAAEAAPELAFIASFRDEASRLSVLFAQGQLPVRVTHNDTKANNVLFDRISKRPLLVIDLDTVMPGMACYDFGDAVRFICSTAAEDEPDLSRVSLDTARFRAFCKGYLAAAKTVLSPLERSLLVSAVFSVTMELAARFLDDYLTGDTYFKVLYPGHNLVRTRCQLELARDMLRRQDEMESITREMLREA